MEETKTEFQKGYEEGIAHMKPQIEKRAMDMYCQQNWLVNPNHVFQVSPSGIPYLNLEPATKEALRELKSQAQVLQKMDIWKVMQETIKQKAIDLALKGSTEWNHVLPGKMMVHNLGVLNSIVEALANIDINKLPETSGKLKEIMIQ